MDRSIPSSYLQALTIRLAAGLESMDQVRLAKHATYFLAAGHPDGGFVGRDTPSDLYYTGFSLRGLAMLGELTGRTAEKAADYLKGHLAGKAPMVDFLSLIYGASILEAATGCEIFANVKSDWADSTAQLFEQLRREDGGYAKSQDAGASSTYHCFLIVLCQELIGRPLVDVDRLADFILSQRREDGGFVEIRAMRLSGTNPTAAAIGLLQILGRLDPEVREGAIQFLLRMQTDEGGLRANSRIPVADLLSTFTGLLTLADLDALEQIEAASTRRFIESLERPEGGFHGALWDTGHDVEYAFYGLGALSLLTALPSSSPNR